jgi:hypothetical protein
MLIGIAAMLTGLSVKGYAQQQEKRDRTNESQTSVTGCLNKDSSGGYMLTDETTGAKMTVTGSPDLEKYSSNHKVRVTGTLKKDNDNKSVLEVSKVEHVADSCTAPSK